MQHEITGLAESRSAYQPIQRVKDLSESYQQVETEFRHTVLVVDDEDSVRSLVSRVLARSGYEVLTAANGVQGIDLFCRHLAVIDCVLLDVKMPVMSGEQMVHVLRMFSSDVPVVMMSGLIEVELVSRLHNLSISSFLHKPFVLSELCSHIRQAVSIYPSPSLHQRMTMI